MRVPVTLPELGCSSARFGLWLVEPGEFVYEGDRLAEVLLQGAIVEITAPVTGQLLERLAWPRDLLKTGQVLAIVEAEEASR